MKPSKKLQHFFRDLNQWSFYSIILSLFVLLPGAAIFFYLFHGPGEMWDHVVTYYLPDYVRNSVFLIVGTGLLSFLIGTSSAWVVSNYAFPFRNLVDWLLILPLAIPSYITAYAYVGLLGNGGSFIGFLNGLGISIRKIEMMNIYGLIWVLSFSLFPYVYVSTRALFSSFPKSVRESAAMLGVSNRRYFFSIALPLASPAIIGGLYLVIMEVLNDYGAAKYYGINTFTTGIFRTWTALEDLQSSIYLAALLIVLVFLLIGIAQYLRGRKSFAFKAVNEKQSKRERTPLCGRKSVIYMTIVILPVLFGFILPVFQLFYWASFTYTSMLNIDLLWITLQSFGVAFFAGLLIIFAALGLIYATEWSHFKPFKWLTKATTIGYVIPGAIIGIGIIRSSQTVIDFFAGSFGLEIGYLFYGSSVVLIYAYLFRFLAVAYNPIESNSLKLGRNLSESSHLLGLNRIKTFFKINFPLLRKTLIGAFFLVFVDIMKELPLTLILKPYNLNTLAVKAYEYADDELLAEAALPALFLVSIICLLMLIFNFKKQEYENS